MSVFFYTCVSTKCIVFRIQKLKCKTMRRLQQLLQSRIVSPDDILYFTFKKNTFTGRIAQGGLIWKCTWQKVGDESIDIFSKVSMVDKNPIVRTFESLTDWTETCIQECLDEYHTRYSSWKRVRHQRTDQTMEVLFKHLQRKKLNPTSDIDPAKQLLMFEQLASNSHHISLMTTALQKWHRWFETNHPNLACPIGEVPEPEPVQRDNNPRVQPFVLTSETGQYMILHRINELAPPECVSWLKNNGPDEFKNILDKLPKTMQFEPASAGTDVWTKPDNDTAKRFLHTFFSVK